MDRLVKRRSYSSPIRREQAQATRLKVLESARKLFLKQGYAATAISEVARSAGVSPETIYAVFGTKRELLSALIEFAMAGDEERVPIMRRTWVKELLAESDQRRRLRMWIRHTCQTLERTSPVHAIIRDAAASEREIAVLRQRLQRKRLRQQKALLRLVTQIGPLRKELEAEPGETFWLLASPELQHLIRVEKGWSQKHYERWLTHVLEVILLMERPSAPCDTRR
jgi:AcrR family transcriptional regulator